MRQDKMAAANTLEAVAREWVENRSNDWTTGHKALTLLTLEQDAFPSLGHRPIAEITPAELLATMRTIEKRSALEVANRVLQRCSSVFRYGIATDRCNSNPATELRGALKRPKRGHYTTIEKGGFPKLLRDIDGYQGSPTTTYALQLFALIFPHQRIDRGRMERNRPQACRMVNPCRTDENAPPSSCAVIRSSGGSFQKGCPANG
jgi:integrase